MRHSTNALRTGLPLLAFVGGLVAGAPADSPSARGTTARSALLALPQAEAGPLRRPRIHTLLIDLTHIEANNGERDDRRTAQQIQQQIVAIRIELLRAMAGEQALPVALQMTLSNLYQMAGLNSRSAENDYDLVMRVAGSIEQMRLRAEHVLSNLGRYAPPPLPPGYRQPGALYVPEPYVPPPMPPPVMNPQPPIYQQPPVQPPSPPIYQAPPVYQQPQPGYPQATGMPLSPPQFQGLLSQVQRLAFSDEKINAVQDAVRSGYFFTCEQIVQLMHTSAFGDDQVKIGSLLFPRAVDPQNFSLLTSALTFESDRQRLRRACGR